MDTLTHLETNPRGASGPGLLWVAVRLGLGILQRGHGCLRALRGHRGNRGCRVTRLQADGIH